MPRSSSRSSPATTPRKFQASLAPPAWCSSKFTKCRSDFFDRPCNMGGVNHRRLMLRLAVGAIFAARFVAAAAARPEALLVIAADQHSAYERTAQFVARVDRLRADNP